MPNLEKLLLPRTFPPCPILLLSMILYGVEYHFSRFGSAVLAVSHTSLLLTPRELPLGARRMRNREVLDSVLALFSNS